LRFSGQALPRAVSDVISKATQAALTRALSDALKTIPKEGRGPEPRAHKALAILSGAMGGALGASAVLVELPISTTIMLPSIARIAQSEGEDLENPETALACLQVFALGGRTGSDNLHEAGYFAVRAMTKSGVVTLTRT
jgi:EcsC protein family